jgi:hypothetical protein
MECDLDDGALRVESTYFPESRRLVIRPTFRDRAGRIIELHDSHSATKEHRFGVVRYLYPKEELASLLREKGLAVKESNHHSSREHYSLIGSKCSPKQRRGV